LRVLHFYSHYHPDTFGGGEQLINQICRGTSTLGVENTVLTLSPTAAPPLVRVDGHEVHRCRIDFTIASNRFSLAIVGRLRALAAQVDLVHCYYPWPWGDLACLLAGVRKPLVVSQLSDIVKQRVLQFVHRPVEALLLRRAGAIVATSPNYVRGSAVLARHPDKVQVIPVGLDDRDYPPADPALREQWRARVGERFFLFVGVLRYYKGLEYLLEALAGTNIRVVLVGTGPREAFLKQRARELRLDNLSFLGRVSEADKRALLELCHGFVFPSHLRSESFGVSLLEAARYGKPMICCEIGTGTSFVNIDGETGLVVPPADPAALRQAMQRLDTDAALAARFGAGARRRFLEVFQMQAMAEAYLATYRRLTAQ
jgi:glycosyltransferase involved in cell wall biosynthesis